jgi:protein regulator of cytokinesis 1
VTTEKKTLVEDAQKMITTIRQMEASLDDGRPRRDYQDDELKITYPLTRCLQTLKEKHMHVSRLHRERYEQVKSMPSAPDQESDLVKD